MTALLFRLPVGVTAMPVHVLPAARPAKAAEWQTLSEEDRGLGDGTAVALSPSMRLLTSFALLACVASASACVVSDRDSSLLVSNRSDFEIHEMYVTDVGSATWGPNLLGGDVLLPDESMYVLLECGTYDALLIDETGAGCEVYDVDLCFEDADWIISNRSCALFEARAAAAAAAK
jgi:hypothetical protein